MSNLLQNILPDPGRKIVFVYPDVSVSQCCEIMTKNDIGALLVTDEVNVIGIVSERDIVRRCVCKGFDASKAVARDIACADITVLWLHDTVEKAMQAMSTTRRRHVLIQDKTGIISILSIGDILYYILEDKSRMIEQLENYIHTY